MLYIENVDDCTFRMYGTNVSKTGVKILGKQGLTAKAQEPAYNEVQGRVSIYNFQKDEKLLNHKPINEIVIDGVVYGTAEAFVQAFNALMTECCCGGGGASDLTEITELLTDIYAKIVEMAACNCRDCNGWSIGTVETASYTIPAWTVHSVTIIVEEGTVNVSNGTDNADLIEGESVTFNASTLIGLDVVIDATLGKAIYIVTTCNVTTTTTTAEVTTTTTTECNFAIVYTDTADYVLDFPSHNEGGGPN